MLAYVLGFTLGLPTGLNYKYYNIGFFFKENKLDAPVKVNFHSISEAFRIFG